MCSVKVHTNLAYFHYKKEPVRFMWSFNENVIISIELKHAACLPAGESFYSANNVNQIYFLDYE